MHPAGRGEARRPHRIHLHRVEVAATLHRCLDLMQALVILHNSLIDLDASGVREVFDQRRAAVGHVRPEQIDHLFPASGRAAATRTQQTARQGCTADGPYDAQEGTTAERTSLPDNAHGLCSYKVGWASRLNWVS